MDQEASVILHDIGETRDSLTDKLVLLEGQVKETMENAKATVNDTIQNVKSSVHDTVESVKESLSVRRKVEQYPWAMVGASVATGFLVGRMIGKNSDHEESYRDLPNFEARYGNTNQSNLYYPLTPPTRFAEEIPSVPRGPSLFQKFTEMFQDEIEMVKGMIVQAAMEKIRHTATDSFPNLKAQIDQVINSAETKVPNAPSTT